MYVSLGLHATPAEAAHVYDKAVRARGGTSVNFPRLGTDETQAVAAVRGQPRDPVPMPADAQRYMGVHWHQEVGMWQVMVWNPASKEDEFLGHFRADQAKEAALAYDAAARTHGVKSLNFLAPGTDETQAFFGKQQRHPRRGTGFTGVSKTPLSTFRACAKPSASKKVGLGTYGTKEAAAHAYDAYMVANQPDVSADKLNFPEEASAALRRKRAASPVVQDGKRARAAPDAALDVTDDGDDDGLPNASADDMDDDAAHAADNDAPQAAATTPPSDGAEANIGDASAAAVGDDAVPTLQSASSLSDAANSELQSHASSRIAALEAALAVRDAALAEQARELSDARASAAAATVRADAAEAEQTRALSHARASSAYAQLEASEHAETQQLLHAATARADAAEVEQAHLARELRDTAHRMRNAQAHATTLRGAVGLKADRLDDATGAAAVATSAAAKSQAACEDAERRLAVAHTELADAEENSWRQQQLLQLARSGRGQDAARAEALPWRTARLLHHLRHGIYVRARVTPQGVGLVALVDVREDTPLLRPNCLPNGAWRACARAFHTVHAS
jgi:hypothetical protein